MNKVEAEAAARELARDFPFDLLETELEQIAPCSWHFDDEYLDLDLVRQLRAHGIPSLVFTVNDIGRARELRQLGVAGIFTDYPSKMTQID